MSDSVAELRARIQKLSSEIELQKKLLTKLEHDKFLAQRQLNAVLDPVARLPLEISSEIFLRCLPPLPALNLPASGTRRRPHPLPILLLNICNAWTTIALSIPDLWTAIDIIFPCAEGFQEVLQTWLQRARNRPLSISFRGDLYGRSAVAGIIWQHGRQLRNLEICADTEDEEGDKVIDLFGGAIPGPLPMLETLAIRGLIDMQEFHGSQILQLLRLAPNVVECIIHGVSPVWYIALQSQMPVLSNLRRLLFGPCTESPKSDDDLLKRLSLPTLETLSVSLRYVSSDKLFSFLERSSPPLQELVVGGGHEPRDSFRLQECLRLLPSLTRFKVWFPDSDFAPILFTALVDSSFLPNLRNLTIHNLTQLHIPESSWGTLLRALSARRTQLQAVRLELRDGPPPVDMALFRELVDGGMQIYIGTEELNFIVA
ncbi:F-box domain-containing protein [Mycena venus]|uniref:F-box domain-containing protein n=1 Tax=Mycena venus TaxID=2733690 RepID=A0A8H6U564_9AGAR|nr:F-box domain-containing protein [Mycena venus]